MKKILIVLTSLFLLSSCGVSYDTLRSQNRNNLSKIILGLPINEVKTIMGETMSESTGGEIIRNPYSIERIENKGKEKGKDKGKKGKGKDKDSEKQQPTASSIIVAPATADDTGFPAGAAVLWLRKGTSMPARNSLDHPDADAR